MEEYVLDSYALLAYFNSELFGSDVLKLFEAARDQIARLYLSQINLGEVFYIVLRQRGPKKRKILSGLFIQAIVLDCLV